jgi:hypothetical protein
MLGTFQLGFVRDELELHYQSDVLRRLNRTEYANAVRDLRDIDVDG